jgi:hypothetical protein
VYYILNAFGREDFEWTHHKKLLTFMVLDMLNALSSSLCNVYVKKKLWFINMCRYYVNQENKIKDKEVLLE